MENKDKIDDLTEIKGIGSDRQKYLREVLGIKTFEDLAHISIKKTVSRLKAEGQIISENNINSWISQAKVRMTIKAVPSVKTRKDSQVNSNSVSNNNNWQTIATFVVEFQKHLSESEKNTQTVVQHMETEKEIKWSGIEKEKLCEWILSELEDDRLPEMTSQEANQRVQKPSPISLKINSLLIIQPPDSNTSVVADMGGSKVQSTIVATKPCSLLIPISFTGENTTEISKNPVHCTIDLYVKSLSTGKKQQLSNSYTSTVDNREKTYQINLKKHSLQPGAYRLEVVATLKSNPPVFTYSKLPLFHVI